MALTIIWQRTKLLLYNYCTPDYGMWNFEKIPHLTFLKTWQLWRPAFVDSRRIIRLDGLWGGWGGDPIPD